MLWDLDMVDLWKRALDMNFGIEEPGVMGWD